MDQLKASDISGVALYPLRKMCDERGMILQMLRSDDSHFEKFGEIYFSTAYPGVIKGWHEHTAQVQYYAVPIGMIKLVLFDNRKESPTYQNLMEIITGQDNYQLIRIPCGVINGYKNIGTQTVFVANCATIPHSQGEMLRFDPHGGKVPYKWERVDR
ncbi:MAG: dTDP-4-dehydrorhamnose 3,5-epimerase family protein [Deltaproteobacteria bacterium]|nr:dTDP-4-dehydrorhamnose 3,5-epimerase family protein [Deltaproteobacteria bacterium]